MNLSSHTSVSCQEPIGDSHQLALACLYYTARFPICQRLSPPVNPTKGGQKPSTTHRPNCLSTNLAGHALPINDTRSLCWTSGRCLQVSSVAIVIGDWLDGSWQGPCLLFPLLLSLLLFFPSLAKIVMEKPYLFGLSVYVYSLGSPYFFFSLDTYIQSTQSLLCHCCAVASCQYYISCPCYANMFSTKRTDKAGLQYDHN